MIVSCAFRDVYKKDFTNGPYAFEYNGENINIGDLVLVETKYGLSLAQVHKINTEVPEHVMILYCELKKIVEVCATKYPLPEVNINRGYEESETM